MLDQGRQRRLRGIKGIYANQSRDVDSRKLFLSVMLDQGRQRRLRKQTGIYANRTDIHGKPNLELVRYSSRKREEKEDCEKTDKELEYGQK
jgi:hypothetical protein